MTRPLDVFPQLDSGLSTRGSNCGPCAVLAAYKWVTEGLVDPMTRPERDRYIRDIRRRANPSPPDKGTSLTELERAFESLPGLPGFRPIQMRKLLWGRAEADLWPELVSGGIAIIGVNYGVLNDRRPDLSGSLGFRGGHWIVAGRGRTDEETAPGGVSQSKRVATISDSTRKGLTIWPWGLIKETAAAFGDPKAGAGKVGAGIVRPPKLIVVEPPPPVEPCVECEARLLLVAAERDAAQAIIAGVRELVKEPE